MDLEDIKSPLPPRRFTSQVEEDSDEKPVTTIPTGETVLTPPVAAEPARSDITAPTQIPTTPKIDKSKFMIFGAIGLLVVIIIVLIVKVIVPAIFGGKKQDTVINYWGLWEDSSVIQGVIADYESKNPGIKINYIKNAKTNYRTRLQARLENGDATTDNPDIFRYHASWLPMFKNDLAKVPADTATSIGLDTDYFDSYKTEIKQGGSWMGIPLMYDGLALYYNKDLIDSAQVQLPKSWWDLEMAANKLTVRDSANNITVAGVAMGLADNVDHWSDILGLMMKQGGVNILATDADNTKKMQDVLTFYTMFRTKDHVWDENLPASTQFFAQGKLAFYFAPSWRVFDIEDLKVPELKYAVTSVPQLPTMQNVPMDQANTSGDLTNINWSTYWVEGVNPNSKVQKEAWKFLQYLSAQENLEKMYTAASQIRSFGEIYPRKSMESKLTQSSITDAFVKSADTATSWYMCSRTSDDGGINETTIKYFNDAVNSIVMKNVVPTQVMPDLRNGLNQVAQKYGLTE